MLIVSHYRRYCTMETQLLTVKDVAKALQVQVSTVRAWIFHRRLKVVRLGKTVRIHPSTLAEIQRKGIPPMKDAPWRKAKA